ncbi:alpha/beta fold hydrolase [Aliikangiella sp. IMCC44653]
MNLKKLIISTTFIACSAITLPTSAKQLSIERIYSSPSLSGASMRGLKVSPDGSRVTFLKGKESDYERLDLWEFNLQTKQTRMLFDSDDLHSGAEVLSDEEKARRERMRLSGSGIVSYQWSNDGTALLFPLAGDIYYYKVGAKNATKIVNTPTFETDVRFSPKGNFISFIREQNIFLYDLTKNKEIQITKDGKGPIKNGMAEFVAQEEMDRMTGYWWAPDESKIAFTQIDESPVEEVIRSEIYADEIKTIKQRYPFAGKANVAIKLAVIQLKDKKRRWVDLGKETDFYLPRVKWTKNSNLLSYQWQSRDQKELKLNLYDWNKNKAHNILVESSKTWVNLHSDLMFMDDKEHFIWASESDGFKHLYLYNINGTLVRQLTRGEWVVNDLKFYDKANQTVYFTGRKDTPLETHLYSVNIEADDIKRITQREGTHGIVFSKQQGLYIDYFSSITTPPQISLHQLDGKRITWLLENRLDQNHPLSPYLTDWITPTFGSFLTEDKTQLYYRLYKPANFNPKQKYPVLVYLYGGPHAQMVRNTWGNYFLQYMAQQGYVVFTVDNRGSNYRGKAFEDPLYKSMGGIEVADQIEGVKFLRHFPWVDAEKVGVHGHSYGGYMTLMSLFKAPEYFKAGVSGAPVTDWSLYDTHYTERYMGTPENDQEAYQKASVFPYATNLKSPLLIYHGMADDNVLFKNSTRLYKVLQDNNLPFYVMDYPGKKHGIRGKKTSMHRANMIKNFFDLHFGLVNK